MSIETYTLRQRTAAALTAALAGSGWQESSDSYDTFGAGDGERLHLSFAVGVPSTVAVVGDRQIRTVGAWSTSRVGVKWAYNLSALDQVVSYDAGLEAEADVLKAVLAALTSIGVRLVYESGNRAVDDQGWMMGTIVFRAPHHLPLS